MDHAHAQELITDLRIRNRAMMNGASSAETRGRALAAVSAVLSAIVSTAIFSTLSSSPAVGWKIVTAVVSLSATAMMALTTTMAYAARATRFRVAAARTGDLQWRAQEADSNQDYSKSVWGRINAEFMRMKEDGPEVSNDLYEKARWIVTRDAPVSAAPWTPYLLRPFRWVSRVLKNIFYAGPSPELAWTRPPRRPTTALPTTTTAEQVMHRNARWIPASQTLDRVARMMRESDIGALPVVDDDDRMCGIITDRDILVKCVAAGHDPARVTAGDLCDGSPRWVDAGDDITTVLAEMENHRIRHLPVIKDEKLVGIVTEADIARNLPDEQVAALVERIGSG